MRQCRRLALYLLEATSQFLVFEDIASGPDRILFVPISRSRGGLVVRGIDLPDGVASAQANPLRDRAVLTLSFGKLLLGAESLVALGGG